MPKVNPEEEFDWTKEGDPTGIAMAPNATTIVRIVRNYRGRAITHWGTDYQGGRKKAICCGKFKRRGNPPNPDVCPICEAIEKGGAGSIEKGGCGWEVNRRFYFAAVRVKMVEREKEVKKGPRKGEIVTVTVPVLSKIVELLGGRDGIGPRLYNSIVKYLKHPQYGNPLGYNLEIERTGTGFDTEYAVTPQLPDQSGKIPQDLDDPDDLLGSGLDALCTPTPSETMEEWLGMAAGAEVITDDMFGDEDEDEEGEEDGDEAASDDEGADTGDEAEDGDGEEDGDEEEEEDGGDGEEDGGDGEEDGDGEEEDEAEVKPDDAPADDGEDDF